MEPGNTRFESRQTESWSLGGGVSWVVYRMKVGTRQSFGRVVRISSGARYRSAKLKLVFDAVGSKGIKLELQTDTKLIFAYLVTFSRTNLTTTTSGPSAIVLDGCEWQSLEDAEHHDPRFTQQPLVASSGM